MSHPLADEDVTGTFRFATDSHKVTVSLKHEETGTETDAEGSADELGLVTETAMDRLLNQLEQMGGC